MCEDLRLIFVHLAQEKGKYMCVKHFSCGNSTKIQMKVLAEVTILYFVSGFLFLCAYQFYSISQYLNWERPLL